MTNSSDHEASDAQSIRNLGDADVDVTVSAYKDSDCTPVGEKRLTVIIRGTGNVLSEKEFYLYTSQDVSTFESHQLTDAVLPDRVLDCSDVSNPKLVETNGMQRGLYVALSYVWGGPQPMTTSKNIDAYTTKGLIISEFPQTIQDAVLVTHNLGQRYLWIDALCIIQDSDKDKVQQLGKMHSIYRNSYFTINAACANGTREGFLKKTRPQRVPSAQVPFPCPDGTMGSVWLAKSLDTDSQDASHSYWDELDPITHRGWCYQEKLLPPRSLIFASDTLKYYCQTETVSIGDALCEPSTGRRLPNSAYMHTKMTSESDQIAYRQAWLATIFMYTLRSISVSSDKLPALAAVVEQFHIVSKDQYLAGLWGQTLLSDLLWASEGRSPRPTEYRAPSWSWASIDGLIRAEYRVDLLAYPKSDDDSSHLRTATISSCDVEIWSQTTPFGRVTGGALTLNGFIREVRAGESTSKLSIDGSGGTKEIGAVIFDAEEERKGPLFVIPIIWDIRGSFILGLVVVVEDSARPAYKRVGRFENSYGKKDISWLDGLKEQKIVLV
ncbi:hypothetical protein Trco_006073 [Trichoderma cornu-damae]|uniref:Heterokaryon incompatibility domain-containing protein n=1 Tax=Trichoderma cornu-damae TaxID=654480 RepID=A0A9P8QIE7_9HYPO|nr:hypothetical protein Trco_006073 [Trichoderma cornu-damae]